MSVREAKGRRLSREYMADRIWMTEYTPAEREWYLLTAMFADDTGFLPWDLPDNAANLYRYEAPAGRERRVRAYVAHFTATGRFIDGGCGHALMPSVAKHPRGLRREYAVRDEHSQCSPNALAMLPPTSPIPSSPIPSSPVVREDGSKDRTTKKSGGPEPIGDLFRDALRKRGLPVDGPDTEEAGS